MIVVPTPTPAAAAPDPNARPIVPLATVQIPLAFLRCAALFVEPLAQDDPPSRWTLACLHVEVDPRGVARLIATNGKILCALDLTGQQEVTDEGILCRETIRVQLVGDCWKWFAGANGAALPTKGPRRRQSRRAAPDVPVVGLTIMGSAEVGPTTVELSRNGVSCKGLAQLAEKHLEWHKLVARVVADLQTGGGRSAEVGVSLGIRLLQKYAAAARVLGLVDWSGLRICSPYDRRKPSVILLNKAPKFWSMIMPLVEQEEPESPRGFLKDHSIF